MDEHKRGVVLHKQMIEMVRREIRSGSRALVLVLLWFLLFCLPAVWSRSHRYVFNIEEAPYTRLCQTKNILTVNGRYPGPTIRAYRGDTVIVQVYNRANTNITLHWHGVKQPRNPWSDGPAYITQCPIQPGASFTYNIALSDEEGTLWWHAHNDWDRATVHGLIIVYPPPPPSAGNKQIKSNYVYPFPKPYKEIPIILGEWWKRDVRKVLEEMIQTGAAPNVSDAFTINGQPGHLYPCSEEGMFKLSVQRRKVYLLRLVNAAMNEELFFAVARHRLTVVGADGSYTKPFTSDYIMIAPGQSMDLLLNADQHPAARYYMAAKAYSSNSVVGYDNTTATAILRYTTTTSSATLVQHFFPSLPAFNSSAAVAGFTRRLRSLASEDHPIDVPRRVDNRMLITTSINELPCGGAAGNGSCGGPNGTRLDASLNNISFVAPSSADVLSAYYYHHRRGVYKKGFPNKPPAAYNFTGEDLPLSLMLPRRGTKVKVLGYNRTVEIVFQGTNLVAAMNHPMHLHGHSFYVVGMGAGNFDRKRDVRGYNLVDPPRMSTVGVPRGGWTAIRFRTTNPGVWFMHCHFERHTTWGMETVLIVKNGQEAEAQMLPPPSYMPPC